ncbi:MAG: UDP-N-acetylmuramoyl-tripeptide--D-alanyl-D-alanine ligase [bacterium]|nr:UDP-N-acetylmuramoyl-tripeptide--D-alanyl-D-alanine ligase [bacterium]
MTNSSLDIFYILYIFWIIEITKAMFFWLYFWQLKEYHLKRFIDHFRTAKGKQLLRNPVRLVKMLLLVLALFLPMLWPLLIIYVVQAAAFLAKKTYPKKPVFTTKMIILALANLTIFAAILLYSSHLPESQAIIALLLADILLPLIVSGIVLLLQPIAVLFRQQIINQAKAKRAEFKNLTVVGITGSYGKTSCKEFLATILSEKFKVAKTAEHQNSEIAIARCVLNELKPDHQVFICEMGAYDKGKVKEVSGIAKPKIGIVTGVNEQHLALFGSMENLLSAEGGEELIESLPKDGLIIFNGNNKYCLEMYRKTEKPKKIYQIPDTRYQILDTKADIWAEDIIIEKDCVRFKAVAREGETADFQVNVLGSHNILNLLGAILVAKELGMTLEEISKACQKITSDQGAMKLKKGSGGVDVIDSGYSANPDGVLAALEHLKLWSCQKVIIMPCLIELGPAAKEAHQKIGKKIGEICDLAIITTKDWFEELRKAAIGAGMNPENIIFLENPKEIFEKTNSICQPESIILLEGGLPQKLKELKKLLKI